MSENAPSNTPTDTPILSCRQSDFGSGGAPDGVSRDDVNRNSYFPITDPLERAAYFRFKYVVDRWVGGTLLVLTAPLTLALVALVKLTSRGPGFYKQERVGLHGRTFYVVKLRSMVVDAERSGKAVWCVPGDSRITRVGRVLRKLHLDELPQLYNVLMGDMSLVGPRPERPQICDDLAKEIDGYFDRNNVKPGITGLAQINLPPDLTLDDVRRKQTLDIRYIAEANAWLDTRMVMLTALYMFGLKGPRMIQWMGLCRKDLVEQTNVVAQPTSQEKSLPYDDDEPVGYCEEDSASDEFDENFVRLPR